VSDGPDPGTVIVGIFLILFGGCITLAGGGCTVFLIGNIGSWGRDWGMILPLLALSAGVLAVGVLLVRAALRMLGPPR
jgi:hypothetical protein